MNTYKNILLALDHIKDDDHPVMKKTMDIVTSSNANLYIVHIVQPYHEYVPPYLSQDYIDETKELELKEAKKYLLNIGKTLSIPVERQFVASGVPHKEILKCADEVNADLIVIGSHGKHGLSLFLQGSTANDVLHKAKCDILAVKISGKI